MRVGAYRLGSQAALLPSPPLQLSLCLPIPYTKCYLTQHLCLVNGAPVADICRDNVSTATIHARLNTAVYKNEDQEAVVQEDNDVKPFLIIDVALSAIKHCHEGMVCFNITSILRPAPVLSA